MIPFMLILHLLGIVLWLGGAIGAMTAGMRARAEDRRVQGAVARIQAAMHRTVIAPGVLLTVISGVYLSFPAMEGGAPSGWLMVMQGAGLAAALLVLFVSLPTTSRLARVDPTGQNAAAFDAVRKRQAMVGSIAGTLGLLALVAGVLVRF